MRTILAFSLALVAAPAVAQQAAPDVSVAVVYPASGDEVPYTVTAEGTVSDTAAEVWVVVHPTATGDYYVQPRGEVGGDGGWTALVYFGRSGSVDVGARFEIQAVADPAVALHEAQVLSGFPAGRARSRIVRDLVRR